MSRVPYTTSLLHSHRRLVGQNIHQLRIQQKMPLHRLARLSGVSENLLDRYEIGKGEVNLRDLVRISCALRVEMGKLMGTV